MNNNMMVDGAYWIPHYRDAVLILKDDVYYLQAAKMNFNAPSENDLRNINQTWAKNAKKTECQEYEYDMLGLEKINVERSFEKDELFRDQETLKPKRKMR